MKPLKTKISLTIDDPILERIKILAEEKDRSVSSYINLVLRAHLRKIDGKKAENLQDSLDRGRKLTYNKQLQSIDREQYPAAGRQREDGR